MIGPEAGLEAAPGAARSSEPQRTKFKASAEALVAEVTPPVDVVDDFQLVRGGYSYEEGEVSNSNEISSALEGFMSIFGYQRAPGERKQSLDQAEDTAQDKAEDAVQDYES